MTAFLTRSKPAALISAILENKICQDEIERNLIFLTALISILLGTIYVDGEVAEGEKQNLQKLLERIMVADFPSRRWISPLLAGIRKQGTYKNITALKTLLDSLSDSEKLLIISLGYQLATADGKIDLRENKYLRITATKIGIAPQQLDVIESGCGIKIKLDRETLNCVSDLLKPERFRSLAPSLVEIAREIHQSLPSPQSDRIPFHSIPYSKKADRSTAQKEDCHTSEKFDRTNDTKQAQPDPINSQTLWLHLGEFSGLDVQIRHSRDGFKQKALERLDTAWENWFQGLEASLRNQWCPEAKKTKQQDKESGDRTWGEWFAALDRFQEEWFSKDEDRLEHPAQLSQTYAVQFTQELKLALRELMRDCLHSSLESLDLPLNLMQQRIRDLDETLDLLLIDKLLSQISKAISKKPLVESFDWEDTEVNENFSLDLTPIVDDVMESILQIKRGSRSQIRQKVFNRGWKRFAKSKDKIHTTIREEIDRLWDEQVTLTLSLLDVTIELYATLLKRDMTA